MKTAVMKFLNDEAGASAIEYGLIAGMVAIAIIAGLTTIRTQLIAIFAAIGTALTTASTP